jgi:hypothetical protein
MSEWWTYGLSDFLMFSPEAYWRLVARHNAAGWPVQFLGTAAAATLLVLGRSDNPQATRAALLLLAAAWASVAWAFHWRHYAEIFLAAGWLALAWGVQAVLLVLAAALAPRDGRVPAALRTAGTLLLALALLYPLLAPLTGHPWSEAEVFAWMPDPTALATLGTLLLARMAHAARAMLAVLPVLALAFGAATRWLLA